MAVTQNTYVVVALSAFWHRGDLVEEGAVFGATRKERVTLVAAKSVRDATDKENEKFRAEQGKAKPTTKASTPTAAGGDAEKLAAEKETTKAAK